MADIPRNDLTRVVLNVLFIGALLAASFWILRPFIGPTIWAIMIVVPTWGVMLAIQRRMGGRRWAAVTVMSLILVLLLIVPLSAAIGTIVANIDEIAELAQYAREFTLPPPPDWLATLRGVVPIAPVRSLEQALDPDELIGREMLAEYEQNWRVQTGVLSPG